MDGVVAEEVMRQVERNRQSTPIDANLGDDRLAAPKRSDGGPGRCGSRLATRSETQERFRDLFGETPNTAAKTTRLPRHPISANWRLLASISGSMRQFWIFPHSLTQLVDFHVYFSYFHLGIPARNQEK
jgi:hypothetical protein